MSAASPRWVEKNAATETRGRAERVDAHLGATTTGARPEDMPLRASGIGEVLEGVIVIGRMTRPGSRPKYLSS